MSAAPSRLKQANTPSGGSGYTPVTRVGAHHRSAAPSRLKQANTPSGGSGYTPVTCLGAQS